MRHKQDRARPVGVFQIGKDDQIVSYGRSAKKKDKRLTNKAYRRMSKRLMGDAPKRRLYLGWLA